MGDVTAGKTFAASETVTPTKLNQMFGSCVLNKGIVQLVPITVTPAYSTSGGGLGQYYAGMSTGTGFEAWTGAITPTSASSKVLVQFSGQLFVAGAGAATLTFTVVGLFRGSTLIAVKAINYSTLAGTTEDQGHDLNFTHLDSPSTTSPTTYSMRVVSCLSADGTVIGTGINKDSGAHTFTNGPALLSEIK